MKLRLPNVMLAMIDRRDPEWSVRTLNYCTRNITFGAVVLWSFRRPKIPFSGDFHLIPQFTYQEQFRWFTDVWPTHVHTPFVLSIHLDGFILNPSKWRQEFLDYDFIGAPWPASWGHQYRVGNSGFSLRSQRFLQRTLAYRSQITLPEDLYISVNLRPTLEAEGIKFPSVELAAKFSQEHPIEEVKFDDTQIFGYHGWTHPVRKQLSEKIRDGYWDKHRWWRRLL